MKTRLCDVDQTAMPDEVQGSDDHHCGHAVSAGADEGEKHRYTLHPDTYVEHRSGSISAYDRLTPCWMFIISRVAEQVDQPIGPIIRPMHISACIEDGMNTRRPTIDPWSGLNPKAWRAAYIVV